MDAHEHRARLRIAQAHTLRQRHEMVVLACQQHLDPPGGEGLRDAAAHVEVEVFFDHAWRNRPAVAAAVARVDDHRRRRPAGGRGVRRESPHATRATDLTDERVETQREKHQPAQAAQVPPDRALGSWRGVGRRRKAAMRGGWSERRELRGPPPLPFRAQASSV